MTTFLRAGRVLFVGVSIVVHTGAGTAFAFNLTGQWLGVVSCRTFDGRQRRVPSAATVLRITQTGSLLALRTEDSSGVNHYNGQAISEIGQPSRARALLIECRSSTSLDNHSEVVHLSGSAGRRIHLRGTSIQRSQSGNIGTCRWRFERISGLNPSISACP